MPESPSFRSRILTSFEFCLDAAEPGYVKGLSDAPLTLSVLEFHLTRAFPLADHSWTMRGAGEHGMLLAGGGADRPPRPRPMDWSEQAACDELLSRLHHVLPHFKRLTLLIEKCESLFVGSKDSPVRFPIVSDAKV